MVEFFKTSIDGLPCASRATPLHAATEATLGLAKKRVRNNAAAWAPRSSSSGSSSVQSMSTNVHCAKQKKPAIKEQASKLGC